MLEVGTKAPDFELPDQNGELHKLSNILERKQKRKVLPINQNHKPKRKILRRKLKKLLRKL